MDVNQPLALLGGLTPVQFMKRHWQKKPLLMRQAIPGFRPLLDRAALFALAAPRRGGVASGGPVRPRQAGSSGRVRCAPHALPPLKQPRWTLLVQGVDLHDDAVHDLMQQFRFVPDARLDDLMISYATDGGGVGPHFDSYDVFLLQAHGRRRWQIGRAERPDAARRRAAEDPGQFRGRSRNRCSSPATCCTCRRATRTTAWRVGECMTYSIGFRAPRRSELARELLLRLADEAGDGAGDSGAGSASTRSTGTPRQPAVAAPAAIPTALQDFARDALARALADPQALARAAGRVPDRAQGRCVV